MNRIMISEIIKALKLMNLDKDKEKALIEAITCEEYRIKYFSLLKRYNKLKQELKRYMLCHRQS